MIVVQLGGAKERAGQNDRIDQLAWQQEGRKEKKRINK